MVGILSAAFISLGVLWLLNLLGVDLNPVSGLLGFALAIALIAFARQRAMKSAIPDPAGAFFSPSNYRFDADGIHVTQDGLSSHSAWSRVRSITSSAEHIYLWTDRFAAHVVPIRDLPADVAVGQALAQLREWSASLDGASPPTLSTPSFAAPVRRQPFAALRLLALRQVDEAALVGKLTSIVMLAAFALAVWAGFDWLRMQPDPEFYPYDAATLSWFILVALLIATVIAKRSHPEISLARVCVLIAIVMPLLIAADFAIERYLPQGVAPFAQLALLAYTGLYLANGLRSLTGSRQPAAVAGGVVLALSAWWLGSVLYIQPSLWIERSELQADYNEEKWQGGEALLFEQPARIDAAVANIQAPRGGAPVGFFVGFAGVGEQRVFAEEIKFAQAVFARRYDTSSRTLLLLNDQRSLDEQPLATGSGLRRALKGVAAKMRLDRDVLFLTLSSHGAEGAVLSVTNGTIPLRDLNDHDLAQALAESGIKWRVIVISACYSGSFIESLRNPQTIVITAAAPDRTSFGCSDDRDLTYFGEAFFRDSLPQARSLRAAFNAAKKWVVQREKQEGQRPSNPQAFFGAQMEKKLAAME